MKLIGFTNWQDEKYEEIEDSAEEDLACDVVVQYMRQNGLKFSGFYHQDGEFGTPYFDTGKKLCLSYRGWGALTAQVLGVERDEVDGYDMSYCKWAWLPPEEQVLPMKSEKAEDIAKCNCRGVTSKDSEGEYNLCFTIMRIIKNESRG